MSKLHSHFKIMGYRKMSLVSMMLLQFKTFLTMSDGHDKMVSMGCVGAVRNGSQAKYSFLNVFFMTAKVIGIAFSCLICSIMKC